MSDLDKHATTTQNVMKPKAGEEQKPKGSETPQAGTPAKDAAEPHRYGEQANSKDSNDVPATQASGGHSETKPVPTDDKPKATHPEGTVPHPERPQARPEPSKPAVPPPPAPPPAQPKP